MINYLKNNINNLEELLNIYKYKFYNYLIQNEINIK